MLNKVYVMWLIRALAISLAIIVSGCAPFTDQNHGSAQSVSAALENTSTDSQTHSNPVTDNGLAHSAETGINSAADQDTNTETTASDTSNINLWQRLRDGFSLAPEALTADHMPASVAKQRDWYLRNPSYLETVFGRARPFIFYVTEQLDQAGLPLELALLPIVESTYDPLAYSHSHAVGLWQFIPSTAASLGLRRDRWYDGRRDVIYSTQAAITYLGQLNKRFDGDWLLALAAYNSGQGYVSKSIRRNRRAGKKTDFWSISLPRETRNYVPQLLALAALIRDPQRYELTLPEIPNEAYFETVEINSQIDLGRVIDLTNVELTEFTRLNPAYRRTLTPPLGTHSLLLPVGTAEPLRELLATTDPKSWVPHIEYAVVSGDTLSEIAARFDIPTAWLRERNNLKTDRLRIGQLLLIPHAGSDANDLIGAYGDKQNTTSEPNYYYVRPGDSLWTIARQFDTSVKRLRETNKLSSNILQVNDRLLVGSKEVETATENVRKLSYRVKRGDSLSLIASKFDIAIRDITRWNKISRNALLQPGQRLTLFINALKI
jgi:membrane-bound lytic murein transglycosylase D